MSKYNSKERYLVPTRGAHLGEEHVTGISGSVAILAQAQII